MTLGDLHLRVTIPRDVWLAGLVAFGGCAVWDLVAWLLRRRRS